MEVRRQHQHLLGAHVFEGVAVTLKPHINKYLPGSICKVAGIKSVAPLFLKVKFQMETADGATS